MLLKSDFNENRVPAIKLRRLPEIKVPVYTYGHAHIHIWVVIHMGRSVVAYRGGEKESKKKHNSKKPFFREVKILIPNYSKALNIYNFAHNSLNTIPIAISVSENKRKFIGEYTVIILSCKTNYCTFFYLMATSLRASSFM